MIDWDVLDQNKFSEESRAASGLLARINLAHASEAKISGEAIEIVRRARKITSKKGLMETFLEEFGLSNSEGLALMCLAESLLRVPDADYSKMELIRVLCTVSWMTMCLRKMSRVRPLPRSLSRGIHVYSNRQKFSASHVIIRRAWIYRKTLLRSAYHV